eukprot:1231962-Pyramimonas_sp.AAC.1
MSSRLTSRNTNARELQASQQRLRAFTDPTPLCQIGSSTESCPQRSGPLCDRWAEVSRVAGLLAKRS